MEVKLLSKVLLSVRDKLPEDDVIIALSRRQTGSQCNLSTFTAHQGQGEKPFSQAFTLRLDVHLNERFGTFLHSRSILSIGHLL